MPTFDVIAFDADDTLWQTEYLYIEAQDRFKALLEKYLTPEEIADRVYRTEMQNLKHFGYGIKSFALSLIETAIELTDGQVTAREIQTVLDIAKTMLLAEVRLLDYVADTLAELAQTHTLMVITKGDLYDQESKITRSGLAPHFRHIEIVTSKLPETYQGLLHKYAIAPERFVMVGNSPRSDILPVLESGGSAVYIPHPLTWPHEITDLPAEDRPGFYQLEHVGLLPDLLKRLSAKI